MFNLHIDGLYQANSTTYTVVRNTNSTIVVSRSILSFFVYDQINGTISFNMRRGNVEEIRHALGQIQPMPNWTVSLVDINSNRELTVRTRLGNMKQYVLPIDAKVTIDLVNGRVYR